MDRTLDEIISERPRDKPRSEPREPPRGPRESRESRRPPPPRAPRREDYPRDGVRKPRRDERANIDFDWVHDRYEDERHERERLHRRAPPDHERLERPPRVEENGTKLRVDNIHYELTESDLRELFERIGSVVSVRLLYDRMDRSEGTAFVTYTNPRDAKDAITEFNGCNANGQPIRLTLLPTAPAAASKGTLFDRVERPSRSLFDRIDGGPDSRDDSREDEGRRRRNRSDSPRKRAAPDGVDRYVPGARRSRSPPKRRGTPRESGRRPGQRVEDGGRGERRGRADDASRPLVGGRPRKTAEELDAEMEDYWGSKPAEDSKANGVTAAAAANGKTTVAAANLDDDIDMIE